jgi:arylsulfatase
VAGWRACGYAESYNDIFSGRLNQWARTIRTARHSYTVFLRKTGEHLFDLKTDPQEEKNLAAEPAHAEIRRQLRNQLFEKVVEQDYPHTLRERRVFG